MTPRFRTALLVLAAAWIAAASPASSQDDNKFKLKPGAKGKICLTCHTAFQEKMSLPYVHTPVKSGDCSDCHNPHTSDHGKLMAADTGGICLTCHDGIVPAAAQSVHKVVVAGQCVKCHDPHAAKNRFNLLAAGNELCGGCHKDVADAVAKNRFQHAPVGKGCLNCHNPHASERSAFLLKDGVPSLCTGCHSPAVPAFVRQHQNYPVAKARCTSCHDPHGSDRGGLLWADTHAPVGNRMCNQCHMEPASPDALKTKRQGFELCRGCHNTMVNETFANNRVHWPVVGKGSCLNCHSPHASKETGLLRAPTRALCGTCHSDTIARQEKSLVKHKPVAEGECTKCHSPHASNNVFLLDNATIDLCGSCHDWQKHTTHPIGAKIVDPRNRNLAVDCLSCHRSHGTDQKVFAYFDPKMELCVQCHAGFQR